MPVKYPSNPRSKLSMNSVGSFMSSPNECRFTITLIDYDCKWTHVCFASTMTSSKCIEFLKQLFTREDLQRLNH